MYAVVKVERERWRGPGPSVSSITVRRRSGPLLLSTHVSKESLTGGGGGVAVGMDILVLGPAQAGPGPPRALFETEVAGP